MFRFFGFLAFIPATMMLTISFFVLFARQKIEDKAVKNFGIAVAILLWICAAIVFSAGMFMTVSGGPCMGMKHAMMMKAGMMGDENCCKMMEDKKVMEQKQQPKTEKK